MADRRQQFDNALSRLAGVSDVVVTKTAPDRLKASFTAPLSAGAAIKKLVTQFNGYGIKVSLNQTIAPARRG